MFKQQTRISFTCVETPPYQLSSDASHYVIPDAQVLADYLEVFEQPNITGIILSQTALSWVGRLFSMHLGLWGVKLRDVGCETWML